MYTTSNILVGQDPSGCLFLFEYSQIWVWDHAADSATTANQNSQKRRKDKTEMNQHIDCEETKGCNPETPNFSGSTKNWWKIKSTWRLRVNFKKFQKLYNFLWPWICFEFPCILDIGTVQQIVPLQQTKILKNVERIKLKLITLV